MGSMRFPCVFRRLGFLFVLLAACCATRPAVSGGEASRELAPSGTDSQEAGSCVVPVCDSERCVLWRCQDLAPDRPERVIPTRGTLTGPLVSYSCQDVPGGAGP